MIFGSVKITNGAIITHRDSYLLSHLSTVSVRRPYLAGAILFSSAIIGFGFAFGDLLYEGEIVFLGLISAIITILGSQIGQLSLLSRDLRGSELSSAVWGYHKTLQAIRQEIVETLRHSGGDHAS